MIRKETVANSLELLNENEEFNIWILFSAFPTHLTWMDIATGGLDNFARKDSSKIVEGEWTKVLNLSALTMRHLAFLELQQVDH